MFWNDVDFCTMISLISEHFFTYCHILQFSQSEFRGSMTTSLWLRFPRECYRLKAISLLFRLILFSCLIEPYLITYRKFAKMAQNVLRQRRLLYVGLVDCWTLLHIVRYPSILNIWTSAIHNYFNMAPFSARMLPFESYESPLSFGTVLVSNTTVSKNLRKVYPNGSKLFVTT